jgi:hypothetical protein
MEKRKIEIIEPNGIKEGLVVREFGDVCTLNKDLADAYVSAGLAKDFETGESGERVEGAVSLNVTSIITEIK